MPDITINIPSLNAEAYFTFKEPFNSMAKNRLNINALSVKLRVDSIIAMRDMIRNYLRDPFTEVYDPAGLSEVEYKIDLNDNVPILSLVYTDRTGIDRYLRVPANYINSVSKLSDVEYIDKTILVSLGKLPQSLDLTVFFKDIKDYIQSRTGVDPDLTEVAIGDVELVDQDEHELRDTIRVNSIQVHKTLSVQLEEVTLAHTQVMSRLDTLGISLG